MFGALVRHFFGRFFDNEFVAQNTEMQVTVTKLLALLSSPGIIMPCLQYLEYLSLYYMPREMRNPALWSDRTLYLSFSMLIMPSKPMSIYAFMMDFQRLAPWP